MPLGYHITQKFLKEKCDNAKVRAVYMHIFQKYGLINDGYKALIDAKSFAEIDTIEKNIKKQNSHKKLKVYSSRDTVRLAFGSAPTLSSQNIDDIEHRYNMLQTPEDAARLQAEKVEKERLEKEKLAQEERDKAAFDALAELENSSTPTPESPTSLETLSTQYETGKQSLIQLGLLNTKGEYIVEGTTYTYPTLQQVTDKLNALDKNVLEKKIEQGFTRLLITPNGLPFQKYIDTLIAVTKKKATKKTIKKVDKYYLTDNLGNEIEFNPNDPLYKWDGHNKDDWTTNGISEKDHTKNTQGFDISLLEEDLNLPRENTNQVIGGRTRLETNKTTQQYLDLLNTAQNNKTDPNYKVGGITRQENITLCINTLNTDGVVLDNYNNNTSSSSYSIASKNGSGVAMLYWYRDGCRWGVFRQRVSYRFDDGSVRVSVRV
jgi:hypothetical protein